VKTTVRTALLIAVAGLALAACDGSDVTREGHPSTLDGTAWRAVTISGRQPVAGSEPTVVFGPTNANGSSGCNSYGGVYTYDPSTGAIAFKDVAMTLMLCAEPARNAIESLFTQALNAATSASVDAQGRLVLSGPGGDVLFVPVGRSA
jgi:heat shock protein HslJ